MWIRLFKTYTTASQFCLFLELFKEQSILWSTFGVPSQVNNSIGKRLASMLSRRRFYHALFKRLNFKSQQMQLWITPLNNLMNPVDQMNIMYLWLQTPSVFHELRRHRNNAQRHWECYFSQSRKTPTYNSENNSNGFIFPTTLQFQGESCSILRA